MIFIRLKYVLFRGPNTTKRRTLEDFLKFDDLIQNTNAYITHCHGTNGADWQVGPKFHNQVNSFVFSFQHLNHDLPWPFLAHPRPVAVGAAAGAAARLAGAHNCNHGVPQQPKDPVAERMRGARHAQIIEDSNEE